MEASLGYIARTKTRGVGIGKKVKDRCVASLVINARQTGKQLSLHGVSETGSLELWLAWSSKRDPPASDTGTIKCACSLACSYTLYRLDYEN